MLQDKSNAAPRAYSIRGRARSAEAVRHGAVSAATGGAGGTPARPGHAQHTRMSSPNGERAAGRLVSDWRVGPVRGEPGPGLPLLTPRSPELSEKPRSRPRASEAQCPTRCEPCSQAGPEEPSPSSCAAPKRLDVDRAMWSGNTYIRRQANAERRLLAPLRNQIPCARAVSVSPVCPVARPAPPEATADFPVSTPPRRPPHRTELLSTSTRVRSPARLVHARPTGMAGEKLDSNNYRHPLGAGATAATHPAR